MAVENPSLEALSAEFPPDIKDILAATPPSKPNTSVWPPDDGRDILEGVRFSNFSFGPPCIFWGPNFVPMREPNAVLDEIKQMQDRERETRKGQRRVHVELDTDIDGKEYHHQKTSLSNIRYG
jgi:hypothetical protein